MTPPPLRGPRSSDGMVEIGADPRTWLSIDFRVRGERVEVVACGGPTLPLVHEEERISVSPDELPAGEATLLAPYLDEHRGAAILRFVRGRFGDWELRTGATEHPFRFYSSALLAAIERRDPRCGLWLVESVAFDDQRVLPIPSLSTRFCLVRP